MSSAAFSPDGKYIVSGDDDGIIKLWRVLINDVPVVTAGAITGYIENSSSVAIDNTITISDADDTDITGATITISSGLTSGDVLGFTDQNSISGKYKSESGLLTLSGTATLSQYQAALRSVTYSSATDDPMATAASRTISWQVTDADSDGVGAQTSMGVTSTINLTVVTEGAVEEIVEEEWEEEEEEWEDEEWEDEEWEEEEWKEGDVDHSFCTLKGHSKGVRSVAFSPDGKYVATGGDDKTIKLWEVSTKKVDKNT